MNLHRVPVSFASAREFIAAHHRHHAPPPGHKGCVGVADESGVLRGVAVVGRPVARHLDNGHTLEVTRVATDGTRNACSLLYAACWDIARGMGYARLITYTQQGESGASLRGAGWRVLAVRPPRPGWHTPSRPRQPRGTDRVQRYLWEATR
ncbi:XF1762 family protein [Streptomyces sp. NPDC059631]|uniref:XF1762 family protein n=1 Tax=unclassified Streptomyces TaxID=2593676 RepID=UPI0036BAD537